MRSLRLGLVLLLALWGGVTCRSRPAVAPTTNLVLVVIDTVRSDHLRAYGYARETAPTISRLASQGVQWDGVSPTSWTKPAVASILTGLHPLRHQTFGATEPLPQDVTTLAERLAKHGYNSLGISANGWLTRKAGFAQGFTTYYSMSDDLGHGQFGTGDQVNAELFPRLGKLKPPFFLYVHYLDPHAPYEPTLDYEGRRLRGRLAERKGVGVLDLRMGEVLDREPALLEDAQDLYDGEIRQADEALGQLLGELDRRGLAEGTLTIVTSDHGEEFQDHGRMGHGQSLYEEVVQVPLIFHAPGALPGGVRRGTASLMDIVPTVLELLALEPPTRLDGASLVAGMTSGAPPGPDRRLLLHLDLDNEGHRPTLQGGQALALRDDGWKLILASDPRAKQYFELRADPHERSSLFGQPGLAATLGPRVLDLAETHNALARDAFRGTGDRLEQQEALTALGYLAAPSNRGRRGIPARIGPADLALEGPLGWPER